MYSALSVGLRHITEAKEALNMLICVVARRLYMKTEDYFQPFVIKLSAFSGIAEIEGEGEVGGVNHSKK